MIRFYENIARRKNFTGTVKCITEVNELLIKDENGIDRYFELAEDGIILSTEELKTKFEIGDVVLVANGDILQKVNREIYSLSKEWNWKINTTNRARQKPCPVTKKLLSLNILKISPLR